jgi:hypothetical protein
MIPHAKLIGQPDLKIDDFLVVAEKALGHSLSAPINNGPGVKANVSERFLCALACLQEECNTKRPLREILKINQSLTAHLHYTFMLIASRETIFKSMERSDIKHTVADDLKGLQVAVASGTLAQWTRAIVENTQSGDYTLTLLYDKILFELEAAGLRFDLRRTQQKDGTLRIEEKK